MMFTLSRPRYFDGDLRQGFVPLYLGKTISGLAISLFGVFMPIYLYKLSGGNFNFVALYFLAGYASFGLLTPFGAKLLNWLGFRRALQISVFLGASTYMVFYWMNRDNLIYSVSLSLLVVLLYRLLFWHPFNVDLAKFTDKRNRGREIGFMSAVGDIVSIFTPIIAGFIIARYGFGALFILATIIYLASIIPYSFIPNVNEHFSWTYWQTLKHLFSRKYRATGFAFAASGAEDALGAVVWPIFIYQLLHGNLLKIGIISTLIVGMTVVLELLVGKYADIKFPKEAIMKYGSILAALGWIFKIFIFTAFQIFIVDSYHQLMKIFMRIPFDTMTYEIMADQRHYIDEYTVLHEMAINVGRVLMVSSIIITALFVSLHWTFVFGAIASLALNFLRGQQAGIVKARPIVVAI